MFKTLNTSSIYAELSFEYYFMKYLDLNVKYRSTNGWDVKPDLTCMQEYIRSILLNMNLNWLSIIQWTVPQLSVIVIYNSTWSKLIQWIMVTFSGDNLTYKLQKKAYILFVINLIT